MTIQTPIANLIDKASDKSTYNEYAIKILSNPYILAHIMKDTLPEWKDLSISEIIATLDGEPDIRKEPLHPDEILSEINGVRNEDIITGEGRILYDIRFNAFAPSQESGLKILFNVEAQKKYTPGYDIVTRGIYHGARMISSQRGKEFTDHNYNDIKKVYSIWICTNAPNYAKNTITEYKLKQEKVFGDFKGNPRYDILNVIFICLGNPTDKEIPRVLSMLSSTLNDRISAEEKKRILQDDFDIPMTRELEKEVEKMCNLADAIEERGIEQGVEQALTSTARNMFAAEFSFEDVRKTIDAEVLDDDALNKIFEEVKAAEKK